MKNWIQRFAASNLTCGATPRRLGSITRKVGAGHVPLVDDPEAELLALRALDAMVGLHK